MKRNLDDWLENYLKYTQNSEPPTQYHLWSGILALASCLQRKCWLSWGLQGNYYPNLYVALVGPPGGRKGTAMKIAKSFVQKLEIPLGSDALGSLQTLFKEIQGSSDNYKTFDGGIQEHKSLSVWSEEFQVFLSDNDPRLIAGITDLFDSPDKWKYSSIARGADDLANCWLTLFGAITPSLLQNKLSQDAVGGGLISRIIFVVGYGKIKKVPIAFLSESEHQLQQHLLEDLEQVRNLAGPFTPTQKFYEEYSNWYSGPNATAGVDSEKFVGYNERRSVHLRKLCMVISVSESNDMVLRARHFQKALQIMEYTENDMPNAFYGLGRGSHSAVLSDLMRFLQDKSLVQPSITWLEILAKFKMDVMPPELEAYLDICVQTGVVRKTKSTSNKIVYELISEERTKGDLDFMNATLFRKMDK